ncbi:unnamed protein product, partial [Polarella glacialis]
SCYGGKMIQFILLISRQGKTRLKKWFVPSMERDQFRTIKEVSSLILSRSPKVCNFLEWRDYKLVYKRYARCRRARRGVRVRRVLHVSA